MLTWLFLAPILLVVFVIPIFLCLGSIIESFKKPRSIEPAEIGPGGNFDQGIEEP